MIADLPDLYIYNVDVVGEGLVARRRGMATLVDHMVPPFTKGGLYPELAELAELVSDYEKNEGKNPELAAAYLDRIREKVIALGIAKDLSLDLAKPGSLDEAAIHRVENQLMELKGQNIPYGLHAFGRTPEKPLRDSTIDAIVSADRSLLPGKASILAAEMESRILASGPRELDSLLHALGGGFVPAGSGGEPIRNPDSYATGKNFYGIDPDKVPKPASWQMGVTLAEQMLADHVKQHGRYPEKVSFVIWGDETMRHEGVLESQIFYLLGTKPVWDSRGKVVDVVVVPTAELKRPRVDIVIASAAEGMFHNVTMLMDKAVQKVKALDEAENFVRRHYLQTKATLMEQGTLGTGCRSPGRCPHLRRAAGHLQPEHVDNRRRERHLGHRQGFRRRLHSQNGPWIWQRVLGRADGGRLPHGAIGHREGRPQQFDDALWGLGQ